MVSSLSFGSARGNAGSGMVLAAGDDDDDDALPVVDVLGPLVSGAHPCRAVPCRSSGRLADASRFCECGLAAIGDAD
eukprot:355459-Pyramimonas_sp.AAC.1